MHKITVKLATLTFLTALLAACGNESQQSVDAPTAADSGKPPADLVLRGGKIATADPATGYVEALAVNGYQQ